MPQLFSYVVLRDFAFAPNPFHGGCTLATCKPQVRRAAEPGDYILGTATVQRFPPGQLVYAMRVTESLSFDAYWLDPRFRVKRPVLNGSTKRQFGDNIYHHDGDSWIQEDSHHSYESGGRNEHNLSRDTSVDRVLIAHDFTYWGGEGPSVPPHLRDWDGYDITGGGRGHRRHFPQSLVDATTEWLRTLLGNGCVGRPFSWAPRQTS